MILFAAFKEDFLYKTPLTATVFKDFSSFYQQLHSPMTAENSASAFVYVDAFGIKLVTGVVEEQGSDGIFAISMAEDGLVEMLSFSEAS